MGKTKFSNDFLTWIKNIRISYVSIGALITIIVGLIAPDILIPEPLSQFRVLGTLTIIVGLLFTWSFKRMLIKHLTKLSSFLVVALLFFITLNLIYVKRVDYQNPDETKFFIVGWKINDSELLELSDSEIIKIIGAEYGTLARTYEGFILLSSSYAFLYLIIVMGIIVLIGLFQFEKKEGET